jgi:hypothetical protein
MCARRDTLPKNIVSQQIQGSHIEIDMQFTEKTIVDGRARAGMASSLLELPRAGACIFFLSAYDGQEIPVCAELCNY